MTTPAKLVQLIRKHGHEACLGTGIPGDWIATLHVMRTVERPYDRPIREYTDLPATLPAVLAWLGY